MGKTVFRAWDEDDINGTPLATLADPYDKAILVQHNGVGSAEFTISRHSSEIGHCRPGRYLTVHLDSVSNAAIFGFFVTESENVVLSENEEGAEVFRRSGEGPMSVLADAIVWYKSVTGSDAAVPVDDDDHWRWTAAMNAHPAGVMVRMLEEAQERGCFPFLTYDFTRTLDSDGNAWTVDLGDFDLRIGTDLLGVAGLLQQMGLVFVMDPDFTLHAYESDSYGTDVSASVTFEHTVNIATAASSTQYAAQARSSVLVRGKRGDTGATAWIEADSAAGLTELKRRKEGLLESPDTTGYAVLVNMGLESIYQKLRLKAGPTYLGVYDTNLDPFVDYDLGDTVEVDVPDVWDEEDRIITAIGLTDTAAGEYDVIVGFDNGPSYQSKAGVTPATGTRVQTGILGTDPPDRAEDAVALSTPGSQSLVQYTTAVIGSPGDDIVLDDPPTAGNLLVLVTWSRNYAATIPATFTTRGVTGANPFINMATRVVDGDDDETFSFAAQGGTNRRALLMEWAGAGEPDDVVTAVFEDDTFTTDPGGISANPTGSGLVIGAFGVYTDSGSYLIHLDDPPAELVFEEWVSEPSTFGPYASIGYLSSGGPITATAQNSSFVDVGYVAAHFPTGTASWSVSADNVTDGDDDTYFTTDGTDLIRLRLRAAYRILSTRIRIATETSGARTLTIKGANSLDFSDEVTLGTIAFTATGSYTAQDVTGSWYTANSYRYFELSSGTDEGNRIHAWELYEGTLATNHQHTTDLGDLSDVDLDPAPNDNDVLSWDAGSGTWVPVAAGGGYSDPLTTRGDLVVRDASATTRLAIGTSGYVLTSDGTDAAWAAASGSSPITTRGDLVVGDSSGDPDRLPIGTSGYVLTSDGTDAAWAASASGFSDPMTTRGDIIVRKSGGTDRLALGTSGYVLTSDGTDAAWAASASGFSDPMTTRGDIIVRKSGGTDRLALGTSGYVLTSDGTDIAWAAAAGGGEPDPVADIFGTPTTAFEFTSSSLTGLTAIGSPTTENAHTTVPDCLFYKDSTSSTAWMGRYLASPTPPFTAITKVAGFNPSVNYNGAGVIVGVADPATGAFVVCATAYNSTPKIVGEKFTDRTTFSSSLGTGTLYPGSPVWLGIVVNSTTSLDYYWSMDGRVWRKFISANNPSLTVGSVGLAMKSQNSAGAGAAFDFLRVWNSAKTFPGA